MVGWILLLVLLHLVHTVLLLIVTYDSAVAVRSWWRRQRRAYRAIETARSWISGTLLHRGVSANWALTDTVLFLFIIGILFYGGSFAWYMLSNFDLYNVIRDVNLDDSFYYFQIARNFAEGKFSTFDGGITRTNGYHPVWMLMVTPFYWVFDLEAALFGIKAFEIMLIAGGVVLIVLAAHIARLPWFLLFAVLPALYGNTFLIMGMEAAAALFFLGMFFLVTIIFARNPDRWMWPLFLIASILPWIRLEYIIISLVVPGLLCLMEIERSLTHKISLIHKISRFPKILARSRAFVILMGSCASLLVYFLYNYLAFDTIVPVSGTIKMLWSKNYFAQTGGYDFVENLINTMQLPHELYTGLFVGLEELFVVLEMGAYVLIVFILNRRSQSHERADHLLLVFLVCVFALGMQHLARMVQTFLTLHPEVTIYTNWYYVPAYLMMALIIPVRCYVAIYLIRIFLAPNLTILRRGLRFCIIIAGAVFMLKQSDFPRPYRFVDHASNQGFMYAPGNTLHYTSVHIMNRLLPEKSIIGAWQSGLIGYLSRFPVVNLDGLVSSYSYSRAFSSGNQYDFHRKFGITHYANFRVDKESEGKEPWFVGDVLFKSQPITYIGSGDDGEITFQVWSAAPHGPMLENSSSFSFARFWQRMKPEFDYESNGIGAFFMDRKSILVLLRDCDPERIEKIIFSWNMGDVTVSTARIWNQPGKNRSGDCIQPFHLPDDVVAPINIEVVAADRE